MADCSTVSQLCVFLTRKNAAQSGCYKVNLFTFGALLPVVLVNGCGVVWQNGARSIHTAARYGHVGIINTLLQKGEKVDVTTSVSTLSVYLWRSVVLVNVEVRYVESRA